MKQVVQSARSGKLAVKDVPAPKVRAGHILVRTRASLISAGTERMVVEFAKKNLAAKARARPDLVKKVMDKARRDGIGATIRAVMARLDEPLPMGYSASGEVVELGAGVEGRFRIGQRVAIAGAGVANHADLDLVPVNLAAAVPDDVNDEEACFGTLGAIALHGVRNLGLGLGDRAAVIGVGLVGQLAVQLLDLAGVRVAAFDYDGARLDLARFGRAELCWNLGGGDGDPGQAVLDFTEGRGVDGVLIAAATETSEPFALAASIARDRARISLVGATGTEIPYREFMQKELSLVVSRSYGPGRYDDDFETGGMKYPDGYVPWTETRNLAEAVRRMSRQKDHRLAVEQLITHRFPIERAEQAYELVTGRTQPHLGVVLTYGARARTAVSDLRVPIAVSGGKRSGGCVLGVIGAGAFARSTLLPALKSNKDCRLHTIVTLRGVSAGASAESFGFETAATEEGAVLENADINAVLIATTHASHASLTAAALAAGKNVLVEKPLALDRDQLNQVIEARNRSAGFFQVGFNRRFAPMSVKARDHLARLSGPKNVLIRVNAGALAADSWQNAADHGGGRILGELCHFVDLARFLIASPIVSVQAAAAAAVQSVCEDVTATLSFSDGSLATIAYTAKGDDAVSKELIECYGGGAVAVIDNFRKYSVASDGKQKRNRGAMSQDKGHRAELAAFVAAAASGGPAPVAEAEMVEATLATLAITESLRSGAPVLL